MQDMTKLNRDCDRQISRQVSNNNDTVSATYRFYEFYEKKQLEHNTKFPCIWKQNVTIDVQHCSVVYLQLIYKVVSAECFSVVPLPFHL